MKILLIWLIMTIYSEFFIWNEKIIEQFMIESIIIMVYHSLRLEHYAGKFKKNDLHDFRKLWIRYRLSQCYVEFKFFLNLKNHLFSGRFRINQKKTKIINSKYKYQFKSVKLWKLNSICSNPETKIKFWISLWMKWWLWSKRIYSEWYKLKGRTLRYWKTLHMDI